MYSERSDAMATETRKEESEKKAKDLTDYELGWEIMKILERQRPLVGGAHMESFAREVRELFGKA